MLLEILVKNLRMLPITKNEKVTPALKVIFLAELANLGYRIKNPEAYTDSIIIIFNKITKHLKEMKGDDVNYVPLFQGFPDSCPNQDEYLVKRILGFFGNLTGFIQEGDGQEVNSGMIIPKWLFNLDDFGADPVTLLQDQELFNKGIENQKKRKKDTHVEWVDLEFIDENLVTEKTDSFLKNNLYAKSSLKETLKPVLEFLIKDIDIKSLDTKKIVFKETKAYLMKYLWEKNDLKNLKHILSTPTDILRMFAAVTETDVSLATPIRFPWLSRPLRRFILEILNRFDNLAESLNDYRGLWLKIGKGLHPGELNNQKMYPKTFAAFDQLRKGKVKTYNSEIEKALLKKSISPTLLTLLSKKPGIFARKIHHVLELSKQPEVTLEAFKNIVSQIQLKNLLVLNSYFETIGSSKYRTIINKKGSIRVMDNKLNRVSLSTTVKLIEILKEAILHKIEKEKDSWKDKSVWIDPSLAKYTIPLQQRKASDGLLNLGRGSRIPLDMSKVLRLFVYWKQTDIGTDLDLSLIRYSKNMTFLGQVSYTNLLEDGIVHSGDITSAPFGSAEFIDINLDKIDVKKTRYIATQVYRYLGEKFNEMDCCYAGWMLRDKVDQSYSSFDIKTVQNKFDLNGKGAYAVPILIDLLKKEIIFIDMYIHCLGSFNRVEGAYKDISIVTQEIARMIDTKPNMGELAEFHAKGRKAEIISEKENADFTFGIKNCNFNVNDTALILNELL